MYFAIILVVFANAQQCSQSCSTEFVEGCMRFKTEQLSMQTSEAYISCRTELDHGAPKLIGAGCVSGCADTAEMAAAAGDGRRAI